MDYQYGNKAQWRRWVWNRIKERQTPSNAEVVLFLAGSKALDIPAAENKGFRRQQMIAIEKDCKVVHELRGNRIPTIQGGLRETMAAWPWQKPVGVVLADFCSDITANAATALMYGVLNPAMFGATFVVNSARGRSALVHKLHYSREEKGLPKTTHRGELWIEVFMLEMAGLKGNDLASKFVSRLSPAMYSYKSSCGQIFDTVVFKSPLKRQDVATNSRQWEILGHDKKIWKTVSPVKASIAATLAHVTRGTYASH